MNMTLILDLPSEIEETLAREAAEQGITPEHLALDGLRRLFPASVRTPGDGSGDTPQTGAEMLAIMKREGLFIKREDQRDSPELARQIREQAQHARDYLWEK
jgi:hypothetical protein